MKVAFELYRFDLLKSLHWPLPNEHDENLGEVKGNMDLHNFLLSNRIKGIVYDHEGSSKDKTETPAVTKLK